MFCKFCGAQMEDGTKVCPACGKTQEQAPADDKPTGLKKIFLLIGSIAAFLAVVLGFGLIFASGVQVSGAGAFGGMLTEGGFYKVTDYFNFSATGIINAMKQLAESKDAIGELLGLIFSFILVYALIITLFVFFIMGIIAFVKAMKGENYEKIGKVASHVFETYTVGMLIFLIFHVNSAGGIGITLNGGALAGIILTALLIATNFVMHLLTRGFGLFNLKRILSIVFTALILCCGAIIAGLASGATYKVGEEGAGMFSVFTQSFYNMNKKALVFGLIGFVCAIILVSFGVKLIRTAMNNVQAIGDDQPDKIKGLGVSITALVFSVISLAMHFLCADAYGLMKELDPALPIVIAVFAIVSIVASVLTKKFAQDAQNK